ncbi:hypothetical protein SAMN04488693_1491, partial [Arthrobacter subterraneus]
ARSRNSIGYFRCAAMKNILRVIDVSIKPGTVQGTCSPVCTSSGETGPQTGYPN